MVTNEELTVVHKAALAKGQLTPQFVALISKMIDYNIKLKWKHYAPLSTEVKEELAQEAMMNVIIGWDKFDYSKSDYPHAFFTNSIVGSFVGLLAREKRQNDIRENSSDAGFDEVEDLDDENSATNETLNSDDVV